MTLKDIRDYIASLKIAEKVYMGTLDTKEKRTIGVYNSKHQHPFKRALGGSQNESYGVKHITLLVHWDTSHIKTEETTTKLFEMLSVAQDVKVNKKLIKFIQPLYEPQDIGTDEKGIYEQVIEVAFVYNKEETK